ncbi:hypothetical protein DVH05_020011 [Phytophthora capsici]|nr:hypothetical protein DVH05_020011 [Phytophthora capsici]
MADYIDDEENTIQVGMTFDTASHALYAIQDYALSHGRSVRVTNRSGNHRFIGCSSANCPFSVRVYQAQRRDNSVGTWRISSVNLEHENCVSAANPTDRQIAELSTFSSAVAADGTVSATALTAQVQSRDGISLLKERKRFTGRGNNLTMSLAISWHFRTNAFLATWLNLRHSILELLQSLNKTIKDDSEELSSL